MTVKADLQLKGTDIVNQDGAAYLQVDVNLQIPLADLVNTMISLKHFAPEDGTSPTGDSGTANSNGFVGGAPPPKSRGPPPNAGSGPPPPTAGGGPTSNGTATGNGQLPTGDLRADLLNIGGPNAGLLTAPPLPHAGLPNPQNYMNALYNMQHAEWYLNSLSYLNAMGARNAFSGMAAAAAHHRRNMHGLPHPPNPAMNPLLSHLNPAMNPALNPHGHPNAHRDPHLNPNGQHLNPNAHNRDPHLSNPNAHQNPHSSANGVHHNGGLHSTASTGSMAAHNGSSLQHTNSLLHSTHNSGSVPPPPPREKSSPGQSLGENPETSSSSTSTSLPIPATYAGVVGGNRLDSSTRLESGNRLDNSQSSGPRDGLSASRDGLSTVSPPPVEGFEFQVENPPPPPPGEFQIERRPSRGMASSDTVKVGDTGRPSIDAEVHIENLLSGGSEIQVTSERLPSPVNPDANLLTDDANTGPPLKPPVPDSESVPRAVV